MARGDIDDRILKQALIDRQLVDKTALESLIQDQTDCFQALRKTLPGSSFLINLAQQTLEITDLVSGETRKKLSLKSGKAEAFDPENWEQWGSSPLLVQGSDGNQVGRLDGELTPTYGLVTLSDSSYVYNNGRLDTEYLGTSESCFFAGLYKGKPTAAPYDLFLSRDRSLLCLSDRGAGTLRLISTQDFSDQGLVQIREAGSNLALNVAPDIAQKRIFITDNQTSNLYILELESLQVQRQRVGLGILGNILLSPDGQHLYLLTLKPNQNLVYLNTKSFETEKSVKLKGDLFKANSSDPSDLFALSPDQKQLLVMTYLNEPTPFTPIITVLEADGVKTVRRYSIKEEGKPSQIFFAGKNPFREHARRLEDLVVEARLIEPRVLWELKRELRELQGLDPDEEGPLQPRKASEKSEVEAEAPEETSPREEETPEVEKEPEFLEIEQHIIDIAVTKKDQQKKDEMGITPAKAPKIDLPHEALEEIIDIMINTFQKQVEEDISDYPDVMMRLREEAEKARQELENYDSVIVQIPDLFEGKSLRTVILREAIVMMLDLKASIKAAGARTVPTHCPNCRQPLLGSWDCDACGFEIDNAERAFKRRTASAEPTANLARGQILVPDPLGLRILQLNPFKFVSWSLDPDQLSCDYPVDCLMLPNNNLLLADKDGHKIMEVGSRGKIFWTFDTHASGRHALRNPVRITYRYEDDNSVRLLIVDQGNHRVLEVDKNHEIYWEFGVQGEAGDHGKHLDTPCDIQYTHDNTYLIADTGNHRVLEIKGGNIYKEWGENLDLKSPTCAQRLLNDHTLILDSGNYRLLELDERGQIVRESTYYSREIDEEFRVVHPIKMIRLLNKDILIMDEDKLIQVMLNTNKLVWYSKLDDLAFQPQVQESEIVIDENGNERRIYKVVDHGEMRPVRLSQKINFKRMQQLIAARLHNEHVPGEEEDPDKMSIGAADRLRSLLADRKAEQARTMQELNLETFQPSEIFQKPDTELPNIRRYCIDRHHNALIRINRKGEVKWHYGFEVGQTLSRPFHIAETKRTLLVSDTGNNRILEISKADKEIIADFRGPADSPLSGPRSANRTAMGRTIIADQKNKRLVELDSRDRVVWEFNKPGQLSSPQYAEEVDNGDILFADSMMNSIRQVDKEGNLRWSYGSRIKGTGPGQLFAPEYATRLPNGNTLIADTRNNRIVEVDMNGAQVWLYEGRGRQKVLNPTRCERTEDNTTLIIYNNNREMIEVDAKGETLWYFRMGNDVFLPPVHGKGAKQMVEKLSTYYNPIEKRLVRMAANDGMKGVEVHVTLMDNVQMKSVRASLVLMALEKSGTVIKTFPTPEELLADKFGKFMIVSFILNPDIGMGTLELDVAAIAEIEAVKVEEISFEEAAAAGAR
ncbi:MAG: PQQ-binding-like beta-propeller repeat protein [Candidatus Sericytochromatia bacterium]|nr:PQQ-binding-like beta-propeller repeat protein [Candidatus Sericytochromatia bacterium]